MALTHIVRSDARPAMGAASQAGVLREAFSPCIAPVPSFP